jgi:hypothetical protein
MAIKGRGYRVGRAGSARFGSQIAACGFQATPWAHGAAVGPAEWWLPGHALDTQSRGRANRMVASSPRLGHTEPR